ncbi:MAG: DUF2254 domain-containing protein [Abditibacteriaceae bacterium]
MKLRLIQIYDALSNSFWFLPTMMALFAAVSAFYSVRIDHSIGSGWVRDIEWIWSGGPDGARSVLSTVAGSLMTVTSIVFSITVSTLAQQSSHYGPRILRNFTSDRGVQFTLGTFIATFVYCLLVLRTVRSVDERMFVPYLSVNIGVVLALVSLMILIYFIHHVAQMLQVGILIAEIGQDFQERLPAFFPQPNGENLNSEDFPDNDFWNHSRVVNSSEIGYLQQVDNGRLLRLATRYDLKLKIEKRPGDFIAIGAPLLRATPAENITDKTAYSLRNCLSLGHQHTPIQDPLFLLQQLVEIAAHALSPGINEPFTAIACIEWLSAALRGVANSDLPSAVLYDKKGQWRVFINPLDFNEMAHAAFDQIRLYGANTPAVMISLINTIASLAPDLHRDNDHAVMIQYLQLIKNDVAQIVNDSDRAKVMERIEVAQRALSNPDMLLMNKSKYE